MNLDEEFFSIKKKQNEILSLLKELHKNGDCDCSKQVYDFNDLEEMLHVSRRLLFLWKSEGLLNCIQIGKKIYVTDADLKEFLRSNQIND